MNDLKIIGLGVIELDSPPDDFLPDEPEGAAFHRAWKTAGIAGFECRYLAIYRDTLRIAVVPFFTGRYQISTMLRKGMLKTLLGRIQLSYACVGHPSTDFGQIDGQIEGMKDEKLSAEVLTLVNATLQKKRRWSPTRDFREGCNCRNSAPYRACPWRY